MLIAVLGDIHSNQEALQAVGRQIRALGIERVYSVGDIVGYNASPATCVRILCQWITGAVAGNHDWGLIGKLDLDRFSPAAAQALQWSETRMQADDIEFLEELPLTLVADGITLVHSMPANSDQFPYLFPWDDLTTQFAATKTPITFVGHTHHPTIFRQNGNHQEIVEGVFELTDDEKYIVNVGSIGQPRDGDPRAAYAIYDTDRRRLEIIRVQYDLRKTVGRIAQTGLPGSLADRLKVGR